MRWAAQQLHDHFSTLPVAAFAQAFHAFEADLWKDGNGLRLDYADLVRLTHRVARVSLVPDLAPPLCCAAAYYLAHVLNDYYRAGAGLLTKLTDGAQIPNRLLVSLSERLAVGNSVVKRVLLEIRSKAVASDHRPG